MALESFLLVLLWWRFLPSLQKSSTENIPIRIFKSIFHAFLPLFYLMLLNTPTFLFSWSQFQRFKKNTVEVQVQLKFKFGNFFYAFVLFLYFIMLMSKQYSQRHAKSLPLNPSCVQCPCYRQQMYPCRNIAQFDGGSRGNPGVSGSGAVLFTFNATNRKYRTTWEDSSYLNENMTNNEAEYCGLLQALNGISQLKARMWEIQGDSELILEQIKGNYKVRSTRLKPLYEQAMSMIYELKQKDYDFVFRHIPREENHYADALANFAIESQQSQGWCFYCNPKGRTCPGF